MSFDKLNKNIFVLSMLTYVVGMMSVSIANIFGGYYCVVIAIEAILLTLYISKMFEEKISFKSNIIGLTFISIIVLCGLAFFIVNDIFDVPVYTKNSLGFWGGSVIFSQILSVVAIVYTLVNCVFIQSKEHVEILDVEKKEKKDEKIKDVSSFVDNEEVNVKEETNTVEIKSLTESNLKEKVPFMEEEN